jgi:hypothetical protein
MSGAVWVRDRLQSAGWRVEVADARKVKGLAPLACKTDKVDARVLAELCRRDLVPELWVSSLEDRALRERSPSPRPYPTTARLPRAEGKRPRTETISGTGPRRSRFARKAEAGLPARGIGAGPSR